MDTWQRVQDRWDDLVEPLAALAHVLHGSRGLLLAGATMLVIGLLEPFLPRGFPVDIVTVPVFLLLLVGVFTLPREGVAAQWRAEALLGEQHGTARMVRALVVPFLLVVLLLPRIFLALYGIPQLSPATGVLDPALQRRITVVAMFATFLLPVMMLRGTRRYAAIPAKRPKDLDERDGTHAARDLLQRMMWIIIVAWAWLTWPFWQPFTLLTWPPTAETLQLSAEGIAAITFTVVVPVLLFLDMAAHLALVRTVLRRGWRRHKGLLAGATARIALAMMAVVLHGYVLLWINRFELSRLL